MTHAKLICIGSIVMATMGRDKDKFFVVTGIIDGNYVFIVDGRTRTLSKPKRKKLKHILLKGQIDSEIKEKILTGKTVADAEIRSALNDAGYK